MATMYGNIHEIFTLVVQYCVLVIELIGVAILMWTVIKSIINVIKKKKHIRLELAEGIALALEFKIGGELLNTVIVRDWHELLILGAIVLIRAALTFLIQWEIKIEKKNNKLENTSTQQDSTQSTSHK